MMNALRVLPVIALTLMAGPSWAQGSKLTKNSHQADLVANTFKAVEQAFNRKMRETPFPQLLQPSAMAVSDLFPGYGFSPKANTAISWSIAGVDENKAKVCVAYTAPSLEVWASLVALSKLKGYSATSATCSEATPLNGAPSSYPADIHLLKVLDKRDVPVATYVPSDPFIYNVDSYAVTRPGLTINKPSSQPVGWASVSVRNPEIILEFGDPVVYRTLSISELTVRDGFSVRHNCFGLGPNALCAIDVGYDGSRGKYHVGSMRVVFSNGAIMSVGLLGVSN